MIHPIVRQGDLRQVRNHPLRLFNLQGTWASNQTKVFPSTSRVYESFFMNLPQNPYLQRPAGKPRAVPRGRSSRRQYGKEISACGLVLAQIMKKIFPAVLDEGRLGRVPVALSHTPAMPVFLARSTVVWSSFLL